MRIPVKPRMRCAEGVWVCEGLGFTTVSLEGERAYEMWAWAVRCREDMRALLTGMSVPEVESEVRVLH